MYNIECDHVCLLQKLSRESQEMIVKIAYVLWDILSARNMKVWKNRHVTSILIMDWELKQVAD